MRKDNIRGGILGLVVGDALGVPVEFHSRDQLKRFPVTDMQEFGSHHQPMGSWSDDSSLTFCLMESIAEGLDFDVLGKKFVKYLDQGYWTPGGSMFDIGRGTLDAIQRMKKGCTPVTAGGMNEMENGNGSLMRILPMVFYVKDLEPEKQYELISKASSLTHMHFRSVFACFLYAQFVYELMKCESKMEAYENTIAFVKSYVEEKGFNLYEVAYFEPILNGKIHLLEEDMIKSSGYVIHTIEACFWSFLTTDSMEEALLKSVNLGRDTDTVAAITGSLCGVFYGAESIPPHWLNVIRKLEDIELLIMKFSDKVMQ